MNDPVTSVDTLLVHIGWVESLARGLVLDSSTADDVAQEAWLAVIARREYEIESPRGFLATVVRNAALGQRRRGARRREREELVARHEASADTSEVVERAELQRDMVERVLALDEPYRSVVLLHYFEDLSTREIGERLDRPRNTVQTQLQRGLERLRARLDAEYGDRRAWGLALLPLAGVKDVAKVAATHGSIVAALGGWIMLLKGLGLVSVVGALWYIASDPSSLEPIAAVGPGPVEAVRDGELTAPFVFGARLADEPGQGTRVALALEPPAEEASRVESLVARVVDVQGRAVSGLRIRHIPSDLPRVVDGSLWYGNTGIGVDDELRAWMSAPELLRQVFPEMSETHLAAAFELVHQGESEKGVTRATSGTDGRFELDVQGAGVLHADRGLEIVGIGTLERAGGKVESLLVVAEQMTVRGIVRDGEGHPLEGASINTGLSVASIPRFPHALEDAGTHRSWTATSDSDGRFELGPAAHIPGMRIVAQKRHFEVDSVFVGSGELDPLELVLREKKDLRTVSGSVFYSDGSPAPRVWVAFGQDGASSDEHGTFEIVVTSLRKDAAVTAHKKGLVPGIVRGLEAEMRADRESRTGIVVTLGGPTTTLSGTVVDAAERPLEGILLSLVSPTILRSGSDLFAEEPRATSDENGHFRFTEMGHRPYRLRVVDERAKRAFVTEPIDPADDVVVQFPEQDDLFPVTGRLVDPDGIPVRGVTVTLGLYTERWLFPDGSRESVIEMGVEASAVDGTFRFAAVSPAGQLSFQDADIVDRSVDLNGLDRSLAVHEVEIETLRRFRVELPQDASIDAYEFRDDADAPVLARLSYPGLRTAHRRVRVNMRPTAPLCRLSLRATQLVFFEGDVEVRRIPVQGLRGEITVLRP